MSAFLFTQALRAVEAGRVPDRLIRRGIRQLLASRLRERMSRSTEQRQADLQEFLETCRAAPIAVATEKANEQHYEVPAEYFALTLGSHRKYSSCYWEPGVSSLAEAERKALELTCQQAGLADGQDILELGCGWGSLSLYMAENFPGSRVTAVSNSRTQKAAIDAQAESRRLTNLTVLTADMNDFAPTGQYDRVISVEMFEHMRNHALLMSRIARWLKPGGELYVHIFCHRAQPYFFESSGPQDWMAEFFFSGGMMPSDELLLFYQQDLTITERWRWSGLHYQKTCEAWLRLHDQHRDQILELFARSYSPETASVWFQRWRMFYLACSELFGYHHGDEWWVSHYRFSRR